jgi:hypothetical protein
MPIRKAIHRIVIAILTITMLTQIVYASITYSKALNSGNFEMMGTQGALGSPILNKDFQYEDWNKWEMITWGIFLSNFVKPFIDDYQSAFSSGVDRGSKGNGYQALLFGVGADPATRETLNSLLREATRQQQQGTKLELWVGYNVIQSDGTVKKHGLALNQPDEPVEPPPATPADINTSLYNSSETLREEDFIETGAEEGYDIGAEDADTNAENSNSDADELGEVENEVGEDMDEVGERALTASVTNASTDPTDPITPEETAGIRKANVKDLFFTVEDGSPPSGTTAIGNYLESLIGEGSDNKYGKIHGRKAGYLPVFYAKTASGYEVVLDYSNSWDLQMVAALVGKTLVDSNTPDYANELGAIMDKDTNVPIYLDSFGNIVMVHNVENSQNSANIVILPAAANQHLTTSPKRNLVQSLIFNGTMGSVSAGDVVLNGDNYFGILADHGLDSLGMKNSYVKDGKVVVYYDTDTLVTRQAMREKKTSSAGIHMGKIYKELFDTKLKSDTIQPNLKVEIVGLMDYNSSFWREFQNLNPFWNGDAEKAIKRTGLVASQMANQLEPEYSPILTYIKQATSDVELFGDGAIIAVDIPIGRQDGSRITPGGLHRLFMNWLYQVYTEGSQDAGGVRVDKESISNQLTDDYSYNAQDAMRKILTYATSDNNITGFRYSANVINFLSMYDGKYYEVTGQPANMLGAQLGPTMSMSTILTGDGNAHKVNLVGLDLAKRWDTLHGFGKLVKFFQPSDVAETVNQIMGIREGQDFATYCPYIYMAYLEWYGIIEGVRRGDQSSELNEAIFSNMTEIMNMNIEDHINAISVEDKKRSILEMSYMVLHPTLGREYRNELLMNGITEWIYATYQKIVYGSADSYNSNISNSIISQNASGFLNIAPYSENFMTSAFLKVYPRLAQWLLGISLIALVIVGLLRKRKFSWFILTIVIIVNTILLVPSMGEVTPYIANNMVNQMFSDKMTLWAISEGIKNANHEKEYIAALNRSNNLSLGGLSEEEIKQVTSLVDSVGILSLDRSLSLRMDISRKVTQTALGNYAEVQQLSSARWMIPVMMRQFSAGVDNFDYVYVPLSDTYRNLSNLYLLYNPDAAAGMENMSGEQTSTSVGPDGTPIEDATLPRKAILDLAGRQERFPDFQDTDAITENNDVFEPRTTLEGKKDTYRANTRRAKSADDLSYTSFYLLDNIKLPSLRTHAEDLAAIATPGDESVDVYESWVNTVIGNAAVVAQFRAQSQVLEAQSATYDMYDRGTMQGHFGYLWATESPYHYFYGLIKDSFEMDTPTIPLGIVVSDIQGRYLPKEASPLTTPDVATSGNAEEVRVDSMMYYDKSGYIKDFLDLQELTTNMMPYLYQMQIAAGGFDGISGTLKDAKIVNYKIYEDNYLSWLFRSNWVTKIWENPEYRKADVINVLKPDGTKETMTIENPLDVSQYPDERPMVFSEAQMHEMGLSESDLCLVELKMMGINRSVARRWTLLLNYVGLKGITKEVLQRQMATEAVVEFNAAFSPETLLNSNRRLYPSGIDLRAISFDSVMKMLMINTTKDTAYIYGDTMKGIVENSDIFSAILMLISAFLCAFLIPFMRNVTLGLMFYLAFVAMIGSILSTAKVKLKISMGILISNILFTLGTLVYYQVFGLMMSLTSSDTVLNPQAVSVEIGNPVWSFIVIIVASLIYIFGMWELIIFCFKNYRDMGIEAYKQAALVASEAMGNAMGSITNLFNGGDSDETNIAASTSNTRSIKGTGAQGDDSNRAGAFLGSSLIDDEEVERKNTPEDLTESGFTSEGDPNELFDGAKSIDDEIDKGKEIGGGGYEMDKIEQTRQTSIDNNYSVTNDGRVTETNLGSAIEEETTHTRTRME